MPAQTIQGHSFLTPAEEQHFTAELDSLTQAWRESKIAYPAYQDQQGAIRQERILTLINRARENTEVVVSALLIAISERGLSFPRFSQLLEIKSEEPFISQSKSADSPENRAILHTLLKSLLDIPKSWSYVTFRGFLSGSKLEEPNHEKLFGRAIFQRDDSWSEQGLTDLCRLFTDPETEYCEFFRVQGEPTESELSLPSPIVRTEQYTITPVVDTPSWTEETPHKSVDRKFVEGLLLQLEARGVEKRKNEPTDKSKRTALNEGGILSRKNLKNLNVGDKVRVKLGCRQSERSPQSQVLFDIVVEEIMPDEKVRFSWCDSKAGLKFNEPERCMIGSSKLIGATYLGNFVGAVSTELPQKFKVLIDL